MLSPSKDEVGLPTADGSDNPINRMSLAPLLILKKVPYLICQDYQQRPCALL